MGYPYVGPVVHDSGTGNLPIGRIVMHCTAGRSDGSGARGTANYFKDPASKGSAHAVVDSDEVLICAHDNVVCWHAPPNDGSYGIEIVCSLASEGRGHWTLPSHVSAMKLAAKLVAEKCIQHKLPPVRLSVADLRAGKRGVTGHNEVSLAFGQSSHWDPGPYFPWAQFMSYVIAEYAALTTPQDGFTVDQADRVINYIGEQLRTGSFADRYAQEISENRAQTATLLDALATDIRENRQQTTLLQGALDKQTLAIQALTKTVADLAAKLPKA